MFRRAIERITYSTKDNPSHLDFLTQGIDRLEAILALFDANEEIPRDEVDTVLDAIYEGIEAASLIGPSCLDYEGTPRVLALKKEELALTAARAEAAIAQRSQPAA